MVRGREREPKHGFVVAIDGPAGAGKSTLARRLAEDLRLPYVNTGLMYRALAWRAVAGSIDPDDAADLTLSAKSLRFDLSGDETPELVVDGATPDPVLRTPEIEAIVSRVARHPQVREVMRAVQRALGAGGSVIEGRDIGTVVFPDADVKIFLSAEPGVRVGRRSRERGGADVAAAVSLRDRLDARTNPFVPAPDAHVLDTTALGPGEVLEEALVLIARSRRWTGRDP